MHLPTANNSIHVRYHFCRVVDDLVDEAHDRSSAFLAVEQCSEILKRKFSAFEMSENAGPRSLAVQAGKTDGHGGITQQRLESTVALLPTSRLTIDPFFHLLDGFRTDLAFSTYEQVFPINTEQDLERYAYNVAGTIAELVLELVFKHEGLLDKSSYNQHEILSAGAQMGQALQYVNIARDVERDAAIGRVYIPTSWLREQGLRPIDVLANPQDPTITKLRHKMLDKADAVHRETVNAIDGLVMEVRGPIRTIVESYMLIGKMVREKREEALDGKVKLKVPLWRRLVVAWRAMYDI